MGPSSAGNANTLGASPGGISNTAASSVYSGTTGSQQPGRTNNVRRANSGQQTTPSNAPGAVRDLAGEQVSGENSVRLTWKPPLDDDGVDSTVTSYTMTRDSYETRSVATSACTGTGTDQTCEYTVSALSHDPHTFGVAAVNGGGTSETTTISVTVTEDTTTTPPGGTTHAGDRRVRDDTRQSRRSQLFRGQA